ncbi:hypothetical protein, partial [Mesorhizobium sp. M0578]|uniref:hypothetical protein n=1 Tax=Mesorhizobium sp. M0578 TaxID=2956961 RepID=UPI00333D8B03
MGAPGTAATFVWNILIKRHRLWGCFGAARRRLTCHAGRTPAPANRRAGHRHLKKFPARQRLPWLTLCRPAIYLTTIFFNDLSSQSNPKKRRVLIRS